MNWNDGLTIVATKCPRKPNLCFCSQITLSAYRVLRRLVCKSCIEHPAVFNRKMDLCVPSISANVILKTSSNINNTDGYFLNGDAVQWKKCPGRKVNAMGECFTWRKGERRKNKMRETGRTDVKFHTALSPDKSHGRECESPGGEVFSVVSQTADCPQLQSSSYLLHMLSEGTPSSWVYAQLLSYLGNVVLSCKMYE